MNEIFATFSPFVRYWLTWQQFQPPGHPDETTCPQNSTFCNPSPPEAVVVGAEYWKLFVAIASGFPMVVNR